MCGALYIERHLQATHQDESDPQDQQMESDGSDEQDTAVKTLSGPEDQLHSLDSEVQSQVVDKEVQSKREDEKPEEQDGSEQQQAQVVESEQVTGDRGSDQQVSNEVGTGEVKPRPLMEMKPTSDYYSASDATKEEEEVSMAMEGSASLNQNVDSSVNPDAAKEVSLCR